MSKGKAGQRKVHRWDPERKPTLGGISLYIIFLFSLILSYGPFFGTSEAEHTPMFGLLGAATLAFLMGLSDDVHETRPFLKLGVQAICGLILVFSGVILDLPGPEQLGSVVTVLLVILLMNSFNMIDNMDGIAGAIAVCVIGVALLRIGVTDGASTSLWPLLLGMEAAVLGFLFFNIHPSSMFLGDCGTQFLGLLLAYIGIRIFWTSPEAEAVTSGYGFLTHSLTLMLLFWSSLLDTITVFILRILKGYSPLQGGKDHTTHALSYFGMSERNVNLLFFLWSAVNASLAYYVIRTPALSTLELMALLAYILITFALVFINTYKRGVKQWSA
ncbi:MAG: MraY family glycosyltransferase [Flavobacteriales bacterium]